MKIEFSFNSVKAREGLPWGINIGGVTTYFAHVFFKGVNGRAVFDPTYEDPNIPGRRHGWIEFEGMIDLKVLGTALIVGPEEKK